MRFVTGVCISIVFGLVSAESSQAKTCPCYYFLPKSIEINSKLSSFEKTLIWVSNGASTLMSVNASFEVGGVLTNLLAAQNVATASGFNLGTSSAILSTKRQLKQIGILAPLANLSAIQSVHLIKTSDLKVEGSTAVADHSKAYIIVKTDRPLLASEGASASDIKELAESKTTLLEKALPVDPQTDTLQLTLKRKGEMIPNLNATWEPTLHQVINEEHMPPQLKQTWLNSYQEAQDQIDAKSRTLWQKVKNLYQKPTPRDFSVESALIIDGKKHELGTLFEGQTEIRELLGLNLKNWWATETNPNVDRSAGGVVPVMDVDRSVLDSCNKLFNLFKVEK